MIKTTYSTLIMTVKQTLKSNSYCMNENLIAFLLCSINRLVNMVSLCTVVLDTESFFVLPAFPEVHCIYLVYYIRQVDFVFFLNHDRHGTVQFIYSVPGCLLLAWFHSCSYKRDAIWRVNSLVPTPF